MHKIPKKIKFLYNQINSEIKARILEFTVIPESEWINELIFCILTPQTRATNAFEAQKNVLKLKYKTISNIKKILSDKNNYIRFHNIKSSYIIELLNKKNIIESMLKSEMDDKHKRNFLFENVKGIGMKEASHFMRNIGYKNLAILDRHV